MPPLVDLGHPNNKCGPYTDTASKDPCERVIIIAGNIQGNAGSPAGISAVNDC